MKLPIIRTISELAAEKGAEKVQNTIEVLEHVSQARGLKDEELNVIGELLSNLYGAVEVHQMVEAGQPQKEALNTFMQRVLGSIDKQ